jgi:hypothetical protein
VYSSENQALSHSPSMETPIVFVTTQQEFDTPTTVIQTPNVQLS